MGKGSVFHFPNLRVALTSGILYSIGGMGYRGTDPWYYMDNDITMRKQWSTKDLAILLTTK